jgi:diketogulonate reductase-like aldo/keto reductase
VAPLVNQVELHPYFTNPRVRDACAQHGIAVEAHSPLGHNNAELTDPTIQQIADAHSRSVAQIILRWHMQHGVIAIPKSARPERMAENLDVFDFELEAGEMAASTPSTRASRAASARTPTPTKACDELAFAFVLPGGDPPRSATRQAHQRLRCTTSSNARR